MVVVVATPMISARAARQEAASGWRCVLATHCSYAAAQYEEAARSTSTVCTPAVWWRAGQILYSPSSLVVQKLRTWRPPPKYDPNPNVGLEGAPISGRLLPLLYYFKGSRQYYKLTAYFIWWEVWSTKQPPPPTRAKPTHDTQPPPATPANKNKNKQQRSNNVILTTADCCYSD